MPVFFDSEKKIFKLDTKGSSYVFAVNQDGILVHTYYGAPVEECDLSYLNEKFNTPGICPKPHYAPGAPWESSLQKESPTDAPSAVNTAVQADASVEEAVRWQVERPDG